MKKLKNNLFVTILAIFSFSSTAVQAPQIDLSKGQSNDILCEVFGIGCPTTKDTKGDGFEPPTRN